MTAHQRAAHSYTRDTAMNFKTYARSMLATFMIGLTASSGLAAECGNGPGGFDSWLERFKSRASAQGISANAINAGLGGVSYDARIIRLDRSQKSFKLSFETFYARRAGPELIAKGRRLMGTHAGTLDRVEKRFGVPREIIIAIWGLETNYGADTSGKFSILQSLATLAYDCRRSAFFTGQLMDGLRIIQRGDMSAAQLRGGWAGEIGQTQFLPTPYVKYAVDFNGDGRRDLVRSIPDVLASTANFLKGHGWKAGQGWEPGSANYGVLNDWNRATVYQRTIAKMASQLRGG
jgi:lytic murein transglycosylase